ncbi:Aste57867_14905 [Aphanomyces stellatus]|uniref:Aste57867_14905 protein n=1 Tax=Aphanomyces stellatus TaxID=120398 RepID=A0A485L4I8_9STRA|nr:hypothetical protein As57867_014849 [Aphanomyces stellatus]VFT91721.1 Aste57867_14905 [Aphanomyces stellatus]
MAQSMSKKNVLEEEEYVGALDKIIERDFFPDLHKLKAHSMWLDALASNNPTLINEVREHLLQEKKARDAPRSSSNPEAKRKRRTPLPTPASSWDQPTPPRASEEDGFEPSEHDEGVHEDDDVASDLSGGAVATATMTLNHFIANHTSEDNAAFEELQEKAINDHKRKYHWAYEDTAGRGDAKLLLLKDGTWMSHERRQLMDKACETKLALEDNRPVAPDTWPFRVRNPLLFPPDLAVNRDICKLDVSSTSGDNVFLLENGASATGRTIAAVDSTSTALMSKKRTGAVAKKPMETVYSNSRFSATFLSAQNAIPDQPDLGDEVTKKPEDLVAMTPLLVPGGDASPMVTWGNIEATPMILRGDTPRASHGGPTFVIKDVSAREQLAHQMDARNKQVGRDFGMPHDDDATQRMKARHANTPTPLFSKKYTPTPLKSVLRTPGSIFGNDLHASYSTPMRRNNVPRPPPKKK